MMISLFYLARKRLLEEAQANIGNTIPFVPEYADSFRRNFDLLRSTVCGKTSIIIFFICLLGTDSIEILVSFKSWGIEVTLPRIFKS